jgi:hypothetical protein
MALVNCTPHPIRIFAADAPDRVAPEDVDRWTVHLIPAADGPPARIGQIELGSTVFFDDVPVEYVEYRYVTGLRAPVDGTFYIVSLPLALRLTYDGGPAGRGDLLVPYREVRNLAGTVVGCRTLARPV